MLPRIGFGPLVTPCILLTNSCWKGVALACLLAANSGVLVSARPVAAEEVNEIILATITAEELREMMRAEGYEATLDGEGNVRWKLEGFRSSIFVAKDQKAIQFHSSFSDGSATLKKVNEWNRTKRFSRAYLDDDGEPHLELDLELDGGVTQARIIDFFKTCRVSFDGWCREVVE